MTLIPLPSNRPPARFYRGGARIAAFRGETHAPSHEPEDWVASVTTLAGETRLGRTILPSGADLAEAIAGDPRHWLGDAHLAAFGPDPLLLTKLLDAGQRLPVHAHPDDAFAHRELGRAHGKTEAWLLLTGGAVHLGLRRDVTAHELAALVEAQDTEALLELLHVRELAAGDAVLVPAGMLHAVGEGILLLELQQPEDLSILLEWRGFALDGARDGHLGLGFGTALGAVELRGRREDEIDALIVRAGEGPSVLPGGERFFRLERRRVDRGATTVLAAGYAVAVVAEGAIALEASATGERVEAARGATVLVAHAAGAVRATGAGELLVARPPATR